MIDLGSNKCPLRVAIVGSGPSGFYAAESLYKSGVPVHIDMFDRLATPFGLVRGGVAPDHQKIKKVTKVFDRIAASEGFHFFGNVFIGRDIPVDELKLFYDAVIFACGAETDRRLEIPGESLAGSHTATEFVGWYNGHPDFRDRTFDLSAEVAVIIGQGNVAVDVCRILSKTIGELKETDIAQYALDALAESKIKHIHIIGRRGPVQAKFTSQELRELGALEACAPVVDPAELALDSLSQAELDEPDNKHSQKNYAILREFAERPPGNLPKQCHIRFLRSPVAIHGTERVESVALEKNVLEGEPFHLRARGTGETEELPCGLVFRSVGYRGIAIPGVPFDDARGVIPNVEGRIIEEGQPVPGLYATGWIKRGPSGIIGTNKPDSAETVRALLEDMSALPPCPRRDTAEMARLLLDRGVRAVTYTDWQAIDAEEIARGQKAGKPREKFTRLAEFLALFDK
jgi:ferredoxin--NADP+ reductase